VELREHLAAYSHCGIDPELYSDLKAFRKETKRLQLPGENTVEAEEVEDI
jgi:hypothetical protein